jgi:HAD superfamily hydrolase (TIGR01459 family)
VPHPTPSFLDHFAALAASYDVVLSDVWGVVHNGVAALPEAGQALSRFRQDGGTVVLISNAPRPGHNVLKLLDHFGVIREAYDGIVTSGDVTAAVIAERHDQTIFHLGPDRDRPIFTALHVAFAPVESADYVVCSGLFDDEEETAEDYRSLLGAMRERGLLMVCANPDIVVERGDRLVPCAGAIADLYKHMGGEVLYAGKPYRPIYSQALAEAAKLRAGVAPALSRVLAIGDSVRTDVAGAKALGADCLFLTAGIHAEELGGRESPDAAILQQLFAEADVTPQAVMRRLVW